MAKETKDVKRSFRFSQKTEDIISQFEGKNMQQQFESLVSSVVSREQMTKELSQLKKEIQAAKMEITSIEEACKAQKELTKEIQNITLIAIEYRCKLVNFVREQKGG